MSQLEGLVVLPLIRAKLTTLTLMVGMVWVVVLDSPPRSGCGSVWELAETDVATPDRRPGQRGIGSEQRRARDSPVAQGQRQTASRA
jgi:hypothetical protein